MENYVNKEILDFLLPFFINVLGNAFIIGTIIAFLMFGITKAFRLLVSYKQV